MKKLSPDTPLASLDISSRAFNVLTNAGVQTLQDLADFVANRRVALRQPNFGRRSLDECCEVVSRMSGGRKPPPSHPLEAEMRAALEGHREAWSRLLQIHRDIELVLSQVKILTAVLETMIGKPGPQPSLRALEGKIDRLSTNMIMLANRIRGSGMTGEPIGTPEPAHAVDET